MGGAGKTTLAMAIATDDTVRAAFPHGVLWATLGQESDPVSHLREFAIALGEPALNASSSEALASAVRRRIKGRRRLVVLDDVWNPNDWNLLNIANSESRILSTTRDANIAHRFGSIVVNVAGLEPDEALRLFQRRSNSVGGPGERDLAECFLQRVEFLPLAIELGAAQVESGRRLSDLLKDLSFEIARLDTLDADRGEANRGSPQQRRMVSLEACFALSIRRLEPSLQRMFGELGILREKANVGPVCAQILFGYDTLAKALDTLQVLGARALLARVSAESSSYRMHDLLRDYARRQLAEIPNVDSKDRKSTRLNSSH